LALDSGECQRQLRERSAHQCLVVAAPTDGTLGQQTGCELSSADRASPPELDERHRSEARAVYTQQHPVGRVDLHDVILGTAIFVHAGSARPGRREGQPAIPAGQVP
jgi:hypothetical protein